MPQGQHLGFRLGPDLDLSCDYLVIGSGAGGASAAIVLARAGYAVIVAEAGPWRQPEDYPNSMHGAMRDMFADWGTLVATGDSIIPVVQASVVGGTPVINSAIVVRTPGDVLRSWRDEHGMGDIFTEQAMGRVHDRVERELQIQTTDWSVAGPNADTMLKGLRRLDREVHPIVRNVAGCKGAMQCLQGCKNRSKQTANLLWLPEIITEHAGTVLSCAPVQRVLWQGDTAVGAEGRQREPLTRRPGARFRIQARRGVLVAASATGSAPLLQRSGVKLPALGQYFRGHPGAGVVGVYDEPKDMHFGASQATASLHHRLDHGIKLESLSLPLELFAARVNGAGATLIDKLGDYRRCAMWVTAVRAEAEGTVRQAWWGGTTVHYVPTQKDLERVRFGSKLLAQAHFAMGARKVWPGVVGLPAELGPDDLNAFDQAPLNNRSWTWVLSHLFGGAVMGGDPSRSVVGPDLQVRGKKRLHVVDAALLPTTLGVNPQHTIMAVAALSAERFANTTMGS